MDPLGSALKPSLEHAYEPTPALEHLEQFWSYTLLDRFSVTLPLCQSVGPLEPVLCGFIL